MHPGAAGCIGRIVRNPGERCPAGATAARDAPGLRIIGHVTRLTWQPAALVAPHASRARRQASPAGQLARQPRGKPTRRHAADVAGTHRSRRPVEAPDLVLLCGPGDPHGNHQPGSSLQGSLLRLRYSAWFVIRSLPVRYRDVPQEVIRVLRLHVPDEVDHRGGPWAAVRPRLKSSPKARTRPPRLRSRRHG